MAWAASVQQEGLAASPDGEICRHATLSGAFVLTTNPAPAKVRLPKMTKRKDEFWVSYLQLMDFFLSAQISTAVSKTFVRLN